LSGPWKLPENTQEQRCQRDKTKENPAESLYTLFIHFGTVEENHCKRQPPSHESTRDDGANREKERPQ
jgi:hypothetical protein